MEVYLIRHTTPQVEKGIIYGHMDVPLAKSFTQEKEEILKQFPFTFDAVYSSPSLRCTQLAAAILPNYIVQKELMELNFGDWEGLTWDAVAGAQCDAWMNDFVNIAPPNGECMLEMQKRIIKFWEHLLLQPYQRTAIVTHAGVIRVLLAHYRSIALKDSFAIKVDLGAVVKLMVSKSSPEAHRLYK